MADFKLTKHTQRAQPGPQWYTPGIETHSSTAPQTQKQNQTGIKITSEVDRWIQVQEYWFSSVIPDTARSTSQRSCCLLAVQFDSLRRSRLRLF